MSSTFAPATSRCCSGRAAVKFNPFGNPLVSASVLFPLTDAGLRSRFTTIVGLDYAF